MNGTFMDTVNGREHLRRVQDSLDRIIPALEALGNDGLSDETR
jgi:hypothetical protein